MSNPTEGADTSVHNGETGMPASFDANNLLGNVLGVVCDRTGADASVVATRFIEAFTDDGDFDTAESRFWDRYAGPWCDDVMEDMGFA